MLDPKIATVINNFNPCFLFIGNTIKKANIKADPRSADILSQANPSGPTFKISFAIAGIIATIPPKKTANKSNDNAPSITLLLSTNLMPSLILSQLLLVDVNLFKIAGFGNNKYSIDNEPKTRAAIIKNEAVNPKYAIVKPAIACPKILPNSHVAELQVVAFGTNSLEIMLGIIELKIGAKNDLMQPIKKIIIYIETTINVFCSGCCKSTIDKDKSEITHSPNKKIHLNNNLRFSLTSIIYPACNERPIEGRTSAKPISPIKKTLLVISYSHQPISVLNIRSPTTNKNLPVIKSLNSEN